MHRTAEGQKSQEIDETKRYHDLSLAAQAASLAQKTVHDQQSVDLGYAQLAQRIAYETGMLLKDTTPKVTVTTPPVNVTTSPVQVNTGDTNVVNSQKGDGLNVTSSQEYPPEAAKSGGSIRQDGGKFFRKNPDGTFYVWDDSTPFSIFRNYRWRKVMPSEIGRYGLEDWE